MDLKGANLEKADLSGANLTGVKLEEAANLRGADLRGANLSGVNLIKAQNNGADFSRALRGKVDFDEVERVADERPRISLRFAMDAEPQSLQELSRELSLWTDHFAALGHIQGTDSIMPLLAIRKGSLLLTIAATMQIITGCAAIYTAVLAAQKGHREKAIQQLEIDLKGLQIQKLLQDMNAAKADEGAQRMAAQLASFLDRFVRLGGRVLFEVPSHVLAENPQLRQVLEQIAILEGTTPPPRTPGPTAD